ncbi:MAG: STT3 domain-containing protein [Nanoarchaeota archaeon]
MSIDEEKEDEEISIDFSKIKNLFKKKKQDNKESEVKKDTKETEHKIKEEQKSEVNSEEHQNKEEQKDDEEISIDFSKIKNFFKGKNKDKKHDEEKADEEDIQLDIGKTVDFFKKYQKFLLPVLLIIIAISFSTYLRMQTNYLPITDDWAKNAVYNQMRSSVSSQVSQEYPNLPQQNKDSLIEDEFQKLLKTQKDQVDQQITATSNYFKTRLQDEKGHTYIPDIDPYFWMRHAQNILENGHPGDKLVDGKPYDTHMYAPIGRFVPPDMLHAYTMAYFYKFLNFFNKNIDFMRSVFFLPVILAALSIIPAFFIGRRLGGNFGGFIAAFIVAVHPAFLTRTGGGFADTDVNNILFPLFITWMFLEAFESKNKAKLMIYSAITGLLVGLYSFAWGGWWYIFDFMIATAVIYLFIQMFIHRQEIKSFIKKPVIINTLILLAVLMITSAIFVSLFTEFSIFKGAFGGPAFFTKIKQVGITTIWPNVYTTVAEQNPASLDSAISQIGTGSITLFFISLIGILLVMFKRGTKKASDWWFITGSIIWFLLILGIKPQNLIVFLGLISLPIIIKLITITLGKGESEVDIKTAILLIIWYIATIYASVKGVRYILLAVPAFALACGVSLGMIYYYLEKLITSGLKINKNISKIMAIILLCLLMMGPLRAASVIARNQLPYVNDAWYNSLTKIKMESQPNAIINSWWDFGHWFKFLADRPVTFDGTSQGSPNAHWIGSVLLTDDEKYAVGILRMVDCGQNNAFDELNKVIKDEPKSVDIIEEIVKLNKKEAEQYLLNKGLNNEETNNVLRYTHCTPPEDYFITSYDMVGKSGVWAHFGSWDFNRALTYNTLKNPEYQNNMEKGISFLQDEFNYTREKAESVYYEVESITEDTEANSWIAPWPSYAGSSSCSKEDEKNIICGIGQGGQIEINIDTLQADIQTQQGAMHPNAIVLPLKDGTMKERTFNNTIGVSLTLIPDENGNYNTLIEGPQLANSMFTRMFYLNGHGLKYFDKFSDIIDITGGRIIVWKVNWDGNSTNLLETYEPKQIDDVENISIEPLEDETKEITDSANDSQDINIEDNSSD